MKNDQNKRRRREQRMMAVSMITIVVAVVLLVLLMTVLFSQLGIVRLPEGLNRFLGLSDPQQGKEEDRSLVYTALEEGIPLSDRPTVLAPDEEDKNEVLSRFDITKACTVTADIFMVKTVEENGLLHREVEKGYETVFYSLGGMLRGEIYLESNGSKTLESVVLIDMTGDLVSVRYRSVGDGITREYSGGDLSGLLYQCRPMLMPFFLKAYPHVERQMEFRRMENDNVLFVIQNHRDTSQWEERFYISVETGRITAAAAYLNGELRYGIENIRYREDIDGYTGDKATMFTDFDGSAAAE